MFENWTNCQLCEYNPTGDKCELFGRVIGMHGCSSGIERKPRNHFEEVKAMSMEELAMFFERITDCDFCLISKNKCGYKKYPCNQRWLDWLKEEVDDCG